MSTEKFFVYRFLNSSNIVVYVGRTTNLQVRFLNHEHLGSDVAKIEYIICESKAEMVWKEIYYINLYYNKLSHNTASVYLDNRITDIGLRDKWIPYGYKPVSYSYIAENNPFLNNSISLPSYDYKNLIHIIKHEKLNAIGEDKYALSQKWFRLHVNDEFSEKLRKNLINFFRNLTPDGGRNKTENNLWTTYFNCKDIIKAKGFTKAYVELNEKQSSKYSDRKYLAYLANNFYPIKNNVQTDEDGFALSEMLQFIWRSAIRDGKEIWIYIPSVRMRTLLEKWIKENSECLDENINTSTNDIQKQRIAI